MAWRRERVSLKIWVCGVGDEILDDLKLAGGWVRVSSFSSLLF